MYENYTYEYILKSILDRITEADPSIDIREGSAIWYAVAPVAAELSIAYINLDTVSKESFVGTATRNGIYSACEDLGIDTAQFNPTAGVFHAYFNAEVSFGSRWSCGDYIFVVDSRDGTVTIDGVGYPRYRLVCETLGSHTRYTAGDLRAITDYGTNQIRVAVLESCIIVGQDEIDDEKIRETYFDYVKNKSEAGNIAQYRQWLNEYPGGGVGAHKIIPTWNGANTVKVVILDETKKAPTPELITSVQEYLDPNQEGLGEGVAPIGAVVTVEGGTNAYIDVKAKLTLASPTADISDINDKLTAYFNKIAFERTEINIYEVGSIILSSPSVSGVNDIQLGRWVDGASTSYSPSNLTLETYETPVLHQFYNE